jgi:hypothetical protein
MRTILHKLLPAAAALFLLLAPACKKNLPQAVLGPGSFTANNATGLTASSNTLVLDSSNAASTQALTLSWPGLDYGAKVVVSYTLQFDSANGDFSKPVNMNMAGGLSRSFTVADLNKLALSLGLAPAVAGQLKTRVKADVNQSTGAVSTVPSVLSDIVNLTITPYSTKPQPLYPVPDNLFLVGDAAPGGWDNPVPVPAQQFTRIDDNTFGIAIQLTGNKQFLLIPVNGDWSHKYAVATSDADPGGGSFVPDAANNMNGPATDGLYQIIVDFVKGTYTITPLDPGIIPTSLYIVGDATAGGWDNPVPVPSQQFTQISSGEFSISIPLTGKKSYLFLPVNGDWTHKYGGASATGGPLLADSAVPGSNTPAPDDDGTYTIDVNFFSKEYSVK